MKFYITKVESIKIKINYKVYLIKVLLQSIKHKIILFNKFISNQYLQEKTISSNFKETN
jgi:hypothetical protein